MAGVYFSITPSHVFSELLLLMGIKFPWFSTSNEAINKESKMALK
jgi:hypothetical protein